MANFLLQCRSYNDIPSELQDVLSHDVINAFLLFSPYIIVKSGKFTKQHLAKSPLGANTKCVVITENREYFF